MEVTEDPRTQIPLLNVQKKIEIIPKQEVKEVLPVDIRNAELVLKERKRITGGLFDVSLQVPEGSICAILGPSGCGKTTLLKCLVGLNCIQKGHLEVFGFDPSKKDPGILGSYIGYMPQELCLYPNLKVQETLAFFGRLHLMPEQLLQERIKFLMKLLDIPQRSGMLVKNMSGGQQRRVSLAVALIHNPPLILLDEPTVGVDPLLRVSIWRHLELLSQRDGKTVIITTHYIEEAKRADQVAFLREGRLLLTGKPDFLMKTYRADTLEKIFLEVCRSNENELSTSQCSASSSGTRTPDEGALIKCEKGTKEQLSLLNGKHNKVNAKQSEQLQENGDKDQSEVKFVGTRCDCATAENRRFSPIVTQSWRRFVTIVWVNTKKNAILTKRNIVYLLILFFMPITNVVLSKYYLGHVPFSVPLAIVNKEKTEDHGVNFLNQLSDYSFNKIYLNDTEAALELIRSGKAPAALIIEEEFSENFVTKSRVYEQFALMAHIEEDRSVRLYMDNSDYIMYMTTTRQVLDAYQAFAKDAFKTWGIDTRLAEYPIKFQEPIYGQFDLDASKLINMNIVTNSFFVASLGITGITLLVEKTSGILDRCRVSGLSPMHAFCSYFVFNSAVTVSQTVLLLILEYTTIPTAVTLNSVLVTFALCYLTTLSGMSMGILISSLFQSPVVTICIAATIYQIDITVAGIMWPREGQPQWMRVLTSFCPETFPLQGVRDSFFKDWDLSYTSIWAAFLVLIAWISGMLLLSATILDKRRYFRKLQHCFKINCQ